MVQAGLILWWQTEWKSEKYEAWPNHKSRHLKVNLSCFLFSLSCQFRSFSWSGIECWKNHPFWINTEDGEEVYTALRIGSESFPLPLCWCSSLLGLICWVNVPASLLLSFGASIRMPFIRFCFCCCCFVLKTTTKSLCMWSWLIFDIPT